MLPEIKNILVCTDFSQVAWKALSYAVSISKNYQAKLYFMHVLPEVPKELSYSGGPELLYGYGPGFSGVPPTIRNVKQEEREKTPMASEGRQKAEQMAKDHVKSLIYKFKDQEPDSGIQTSDKNIIVKVGNPVESILDEIKTEKYDLAVLGRRGHGKLKGPRTGGVAQWVLNRSQIPVLIVGKEAK